MSIYLHGKTVKIECKGALTEQYVLQELKTMEDLQISYWTNNHGSAEIDFLIDNGKAVIPIEVKAEVNLQAKSLKSYKEKYNPTLSVRTSMADYKREDWLLNLPLYCIGAIKNLEIG